MALNRPENELLLLMDSSLSGLESNDFAIWDDRLHPDRTESLFAGLSDDKNNQSTRPSHPTRDSQDKS